MWQKIYNWIVLHKTVPDLIEQELEEAKRALLRAQTGVEFANSEVIYNEQRIARLTKIRDETKRSESFTLRIIDNPPIINKL